MGWKWCPWTSSDQFMEMLFDNDTRRHPRVWLSTWVAMPLPDHVTQLPNVAEWLRTYTPLSSAPRLSIVIRHGDLPLKMRYEEWVLWEPGLREERVLAYRAHPDGVCACCQQPAFWKLPRGRRGCAASIMTAVGPKVSGREWPEMTCWLSCSKTSRFERMLSHDSFNKGVFETCFVDLDCLSCSCGGCSFEDMRTGVLCPDDQYFVDHELAGPESPRHPLQDFGDDPHEMACPESFDFRTRAARRQQ